MRDWAGGGASRPAVRGQRAISPVPLPHSLIRSLARSLIRAGTNALRGQAWVLFGDVSEATKALQSMQGTTLFDKPMVRCARHTHASP